MPRLSLRAVLVFVVLFAVVPISASAGRSSDLPPLAASLQTGGLSAGGELADDLLSASLAERLRRVASAQGIETHDGFGARVSTGIGAVTASLPVAVRGSVARLLAAVEGARDLRARTFAGMSEAEIGALVSRASTITDVEASSSSIVRGSPPQARPPARRSPQNMPSLPRVDLAPLVSGAAGILEAVEAELPALRSYARHLSPRASAMSAPPTMNMCPTLAIDFDGDTDYTSDCALIIDLVGDDTYTAGAGATAAGVPVSIVVDVQGADTYARVTDADTVVAQGAAAGGVGILVDVLGDDTYEVRDERLVPDLTPAKDVSVTAQGAGRLGVGVLADLGGEDDFLARGTTRGGLASTAAQGAGLTGVGLLVHGPAVSASGALGSTPYTAEAITTLLKTFESPTEQRFAAGPAETVAQGGAVGGAGGLADAGSTNTYRARAEGAFASATGQGGARLGAGVLADGLGADDYDLAAIGIFKLTLEIARTCPPGFICHQSVDVAVTSGTSRAVGQGGALTGAAVHADLGTEPNERVLTATSAAEAVAGVSFGGGGGLAGTFVATATATNGDAVATAHGSVGPEPDLTSAGVGGAAVSLGGTGDDTYTIRASSDAKATAKAVGGSTNTATATADGGDSIVSGQGQETGGGAGVLGDAGGEDEYVIEQSATASAVALVGTAPGTAVASPGVKRTFGRGYSATLGAGVLADLGGVDTYSALPGTGMPAPDPGGDDRCWTNSPPGLPQTRIGAGLDVGPPGTVSSSCVPPPN